MYYTYGNDGACCEKCAPEGFSLVFRARVKSRSQDRKCVWRRCVEDREGCT